MAIPAAYVKIEFLKILKVPPGRLTGADTRYARAFFQAGSQPQVATGRSKPIPNAAGDFDVSTEAAPWVFEAYLNSGDIVTLSVELWEDHGGDDPILVSARATALSSPWSSGEHTLTDLFKVRVTTTMINPLDKAPLARAREKSGVSGSLVIPQGFLVEFDDIKGLYKPNPAIVPGTQNAKHILGYASEDNLGRIFTNREPAGNWKSDTQYIDVQVRITAFGGAVIPAGAKIDWTVVDVDDPTNDDSHFHREWGHYVDANDYDAAGKPIGAHPGDNPPAFKAGNSDESLLFGGAAGSSPTARWAQAPSGPNPSAASGTRATTTLKLASSKNGISSVRIHCPNVLGTNFVLKAELIGTPSGIPVFNARTGTMTMWCRLDLEVARMAGAHSLAGALPGIPVPFLPACVQLDVQKERDVHGGADRKFLAEGSRLLEDKSTQWTSDSTVFTHVGQPGWFFIGAARLPYPLRVTVSGDTHDGSKSITHLSTPGTSGLSTGTPVSGDGIPAGTTVQSIDGSDSITMSQPATLTHTGTDVTFGNPIISRTGDITTGSKSITGLSGDGSSGLEVGMFLDGPGIPDDATIKRIDSATAITISAPATATSASVSLRFARPMILYKGTSFDLSTYGNDVFLSVPRIISEPSYVEFKWKHDGKDQSAGFGVPEGAFSVYGGKTEMLLYGNDITPGFTGHDSDGSISKAYTTQMVFYPKHQRPARSGAALSPGGYGIPAGAEVEVYRPGATMVSGISPTVPHHLFGTGEYFAGRTIIFTHHGKFSTGSPPAPVADFDTKIIRVVVHELVHAFGMPHKCGNWDWQTPRKTSCCMNYFDTWLVDARQHLQFDTVGKEGPHICGRHLMEVRRVHLDRNVGLWWE